MLNVPEHCDVLVVGGGPGCAYTACCLAREGIDTVVLEADLLPRYHIGESMLPSMRHFLRFIDLDSAFDNYGFKVKRGGMFKLNSKPQVCGPQGYARNIVRSEADEMIFKHAAQCGAKTFDGVRAGDLEFRPWDKNDPLEQQLAQFPEPNPGRPISARWSCKDGTSGVIRFNYLVDASAWSLGIPEKYGAIDWGGEHEDQLFFEHLAEFEWLAIAMEEEKKKKKMGSPSTYLPNLNLAHGIQKLMTKAELVSEIKSASDWSYSASSYASPFVRVVGDAGCFIHPFFSPGVHLAMASGLSAAATICAVKRDACSEDTAADWHTKKFAEGYTRFLLVVLSCLKQIRDQDSPVLTDWDEESFDRAFAFFRPIIQGTVDVKARLTESEISDTINFCCRAFIPVPLEEKEAVLRKMEDLGLNNEDIDPKGQLSLVNSSRQKAEKLDVLGLFHGEVPDGHGMGVPDNERNGGSKVAVAAQA